MSLFLVQLCANLLPRPSIIVGALLNYRDDLPKNSNAFEILTHYAECFAHSELSLFNQSIPEELLDHAQQHPTDFNLALDEISKQWGHFLVFKALDTQAKKSKSDFAQSNALESLWLAHSLAMEAQKWKHNTSK